MAIKEFIRINLRIEKYININNNNYYFYIIVLKVINYIKN